MNVYQGRLNRIDRYAFWLVVAILVMTTGGYGKVKISSRWLDPGIAIDGMMGDWQDTLVYLKKKGVSMGVMNNDDHLVLCLVVSDRKNLMQIMGRGLAIWINPSGKTKKIRGIKYPVGIAVEDFREGSRMGPPDPDRIRDLFQESLDEIEILENGEENGYRYPLGSLKGLEACVKMTHGLMVCELRIPLRQRENELFSIGWGGASPLTIEFETPKIEMPERGGMGPGSGGVRMGGRPGGRGGMKGGGRGMGRPGMGVDRPKPLKIRARVILAENTPND